MPLSMQYRYATKEIHGYVSYFRMFLRKYIIIYIASISMAGRSAAATFIVPQSTVLTVLTMGMEDLGPVRLRLMLGDAVRPKFDWLVRRGLLHDTHTCVQCHVKSGGTAGRSGRVSVLVSAVQRTNNSTEREFLQEQG